MKTAKHTGSNWPKVIPIGSSGAMVLIQSESHCLPARAAEGHVPRTAMQEQERAVVGILAPPLTSGVTLIASPASFEPPFL